MVKVLGHRIAADGIAPDPGKVEALLKMPMPTNVIQLRSLMGAVSYYRIFLPNIAAETKTPNALLTKGARFGFTAEHTQIVQTLLKTTIEPQVLAFPDLPAAIPGDRPFQLITDASVDGLGAVIEQEQRDGTTRPICFLSRATFPNEKKMERDRT